MNHVSLSMHIRCSRSNPDERKLPSSAVTTPAEAKHHDIRRGLQCIHTIQHQECPYHQVIVVVGGLHHAHVARAALSVMLPFQHRLSSAFQQWFLPRGKMRWYQNVERGVPNAVTTNYAISSMNTCCADNSKMNNDAVLTYSENRNHR